MRVWRLVASGVGLGLLASCGGGAAGGGGQPSGEAGTPLVFRAAPIPAVDIAYIQPLGNLNPPGHTFPTDHIYFYFADRFASIPVYAPGDGTIVNIAWSQASGDDYKLDLVHGGTLRSYLGHLSSLAPAIAAAAGNLVMGFNSVSIPVTAGQVVGTTGGRGDYLYAMDLGVYDTALTLPGFITPSRYSANTTGCRAPLSYYEQPLQSQLYAMVNRDGADLDGRIDFDQPGRLAGNWFGQGAGMNDWTRHLAFVADCVDPDQVRVAMGGELGATGVFAIADSDPRPAEVSAATGLVGYQLLQNGEPVWRLSVQVLANETIRVELRSADTPADAPFTAAAVLYER
jgi:hypothetical protein